MHSLLRHNGRLVSTAEKTLSPGQVGFMNGWGVFSTIRVASGVLFAFERHWARMNKDAQLMGVPMPPSPETFRHELLGLVEANRAYDATLRVAVVRNRGGFFEGTGIEREFDTIAFTTGLHTWGPSVRLGVEEQARHAGSRFAGTKITSWVENLTWLERAKSQGYDEVVLLDQHGRVSECTSANIFAVTPAGVWTPPLAAGCLPGITRSIILDDLSAQGLPIGERHLTLDDLYSATGVFITSTTRELLPVAAIGDLALNQEDATRRRLQTAFSKYVSSYVADAHRAGTAVAVPVGM